MELSFCALCVRCHPHVALSHNMHVTCVALRLNSGRRNAGVGASNGVFLDGLTKLNWRADWEGHYKYYITNITLYYKHYITLQILHFKYYITNITLQILHYKYYITLQILHYKHYITLQTLHYITNTTLQTLHYITNITL